MVHLFFTISTLLPVALATSAYHKHNNIIDLGYAKHIPTYTNLTLANVTLLNYNNIRYAQPPAGSNRFWKPVTPPAYQHDIQDGNISSWQTDCLSYAPDGSPFPLLANNSWGSEDCLFLNVVVPEGVKKGDKVPVLHWVVGSAFAFGGKDLTGFGISTTGLFNERNGLPGRFIMVTHNYRLGITGWTPKLVDDMNGNIGVWDSLAAIQWTKKYIHKFGGDPDKITVIGQSAGASIISWLLLAKNGTMDLPFDQAFISSPALPPRRMLERSRPVCDAILNATGCGTIDCMRQLSEAQVKDANKAVLNMRNAGGGGGFGPGIGLTPVVDGELLSELPATALSQGRINEGVKSIIVGNTANEGLGLSSDGDMPARFPAIVRANVPNISNESIARLQSMYSYTPEQPEKLAWDYTTDIVFGCPAAKIAEGYGNRARRYLFSVAPAYHGQEIVYFFFDTNTTTPVDSLPTAEEAQSYLLQFMFREDLATTVPYAGPLSMWPSFSKNETVANITGAGFTFGGQDEVVTKRCAFIDELIQDPENGV